MRPYDQEPYVRDGTRVDEKTVTAAGGVAVRHDIGIRSSASLAIRDILFGSQPPAETAQNAGLPAKLSEPTGPT